MPLAPLANAFAVFRSSEVILVLRLLSPAALALGFALPAASGLGAVALMVRITALRKIQEFAVAALAPELARADMAMKAPIAVTALSSS